MTQTASDGIPFKHVGAFLSEFEFQRYRPRTALTQLLSGYDLLQFAVGTPCWACVAEGLSVPSLLWTATTVYGDRAARLAKAPIPRRIWGNAMARSAQRHERQALQQVQFTFALSEYTRSTLLSIVPNLNVTIGVCGVDVHRFSPGKIGSGQYVLAVGRFSDARKNLSLLLKAYERLSGRKGLPDLYIAGKPPDEAEMAWISRLTVSGKIRFLGQTTDTQLVDLYRNACLFLLSSNEEGLGIVILEAMASGLAVVSTDCGGPRSCVIDGITGFLVPKDDVNAFADAISRLLDNPNLRKSMGNAARHIAEQTFSNEITSRVFIEQYRTLLN